MSSPHIGKHHISNITKDSKEKYVNRFEILSEENAIRVENVNKK